jgi:hypothetical protein
MRLIAALVPLMAAAGPLAAQRDTTYWVVGQMVDARTGVPVRRGEICLGDVESRRWNGMCDGSDSVGVFRAEANGPEPVRLFFGCSPARGQYLVEMSSVVVTPTMDSASAPARYRVKAGRCDQREFEAVRREWSGWYTYGFEAGTFRPCGDTVGAWVTFTQVPGLTSLEVPVGRDGVSSVFARWIGTRVGPGDFGHMGSEPYYIEVDSLIEARSPRWDDCGSVAVDSVGWGRAMAQAISARLRRIYRSRHFIVSSARSADSVDQWTKELIAEVAGTLEADRARNRDTVRVQLTNAAPLYFSEGPSLPLVEVGFWAFPPEADMVPKSPHAIRCYFGTTAQLLREGDRLRVRFADDRRQLFTCGPRRE